MSRIDNNVFVSKNGNICEKSKKHRRIGTAIGASYVLCRGFFPSKTATAIGAKNGYSELYKVIMCGEETVTRMDAIKPGVGTFCANLSKGGRIALVAGYLLTCLGIYSLIGRGIGALVDKAVYKKHAKQADMQ